MKIAVISDIHGNAIALDAVLADLRREAVDQIVCLGDAIQGGAQPAAVVRQLRALGCPVVLGNADDFLLTGILKNPDETASAEQHAVRAWQLAQLSADDRHFIEGFHPSIELALGGGRQLLCFHATPHNFNDIILPHTPQDELLRYLGGFGDRVLAGGHTHLQQLLRIGDSFFFNPGSVGFACNNLLPRDERFRNDPWADYAVLADDGVRLSLEFRRVPFDVAEWLRLTRASGRPAAESVAALYAPRHD